MTISQNFPKERSGAEIRARKTFAADKEEYEEGRSRLAEFKRARNMLERDFGDELTDIKKICYLAAFSVTGKVKMSAKIAGVSYFTVRTWRGDTKKKVPMDAELFSSLEEQAEQYFQELLLEEVDRRALDGIEEPIYYQGEKVGSKRVYSDNLLMFRTKGVMPEYKSGSTNVNINSDESGDINVKFTLPEMNADIKNRDVIDVGGDKRDGDGTKEDERGE